MTNQEMVKEFHEKFCPDQIEVDWSYKENFELRQTLLDEEVKEFHEAWSEPPFHGYEEHILKELADIVYVAYGTAVALGFDLDEALKRVHASNMSKLDINGEPIRREDGKVLKGPNYFLPDLSNLVL
jgi:predicted HAD superfamily Cof-like phosphohydrolase